METHSIVFTTTKEIKMENTTKHKADAFRNELRELLEKYTASLVDMSHCGDRYAHNEGLGVGINGEYIRISDAVFTNSHHLKDEQQYFNDQINRSKK